MGCQLKQRWLVSRGHAQAPRIDCRLRDTIITAGITPAAQLSAQLLLFALLFVARWIGGLRKAQSIQRNDETKYPAQ